MAQGKGNITVRIEISDKVIEVISEILTDVNEIAELVPEWNNIELKTIADRLSTNLGKLLELKRELEGKK